MKLFLFTLFLLLSAAFFSFAQTHEIKGRVLDQSNIAIAYATLTLKKDSSIFAAALSDSTGVYAFLKVTPGRYELIANYLGTQYAQSIMLTDKNLDLNIMMGKNTATELKGVNITASKSLIERKMDRLVFNVENAVSTLGGDATDVLKLTPGVNLINEEIAIIGKSAVNIMINDRIVPITGPELFTYLKSIPADKILKIEVITNPPAKYDAAGNSGLINIQLKSLPKENSWSAVANSAAEFATYTSLSHGINLTYKENKFSALMGLTYRYGDKIYTNDINYIYPEQERWHNDIFTKNNRKTVGSLMNLQYALSPFQSIGVQYSGSYTRNSALENTLSQSYNEEALSKDYVTRGNTISKPNVSAFNINYNQKLDTTGQKYSVDLDYFNSNSPRNNVFNAQEQDYLSDLSQFIVSDNSGKQDIENYSAKTDFEMPGKWGTFSFGAKLSSTATKNRVNALFYDSSETNTPYDEQHDHFEYQENVQALYLSEEKKFNEKWSAKAGLRAEYTQTKANSISTASVNKTDYFKLFPTIYLQYKINKDHSLDINFGRRIGRPAFWELNPARWYMNTQSYTEGNPFLQPSFSYDLELNYSFKSLVNAGMYYSDTQDGFSQVTFHDIENETQIFKRLNYYNAKDIGAWAILSFKPVKFWDARLSMSAFYKQSDNYIPLFNRGFSGWGGYTRTTNLFTVNKSSTLFVNADYNYTYAGRNRETTYTAYSSLNLGLKVLLLQKKLVAGLNFEDLLKDNFSTYRSVSGAVQQSFTQYYDSRLTRLSLSYSFGNSKIGMNKRNVGNQEERNRTN